MTKLKNIIDLLSNFEVIEIYDADTFGTNDTTNLYFGQVRELMKNELYKKLQNENVFQIMSGEYYENNVRFTKLYVLLDLSHTFSYKEDNEQIDNIIEAKEE